MVEEEWKLTIRVPMRPEHQNALGAIFGGVVMAYMDEAGGDAAWKRTGKLCVTRAVENMEFISPVNVGDMLAFRTRIVRVGRTSITVAIEVVTERFRTGEVCMVARASIVYVAIDENRRPVPITDPKEEGEGG